MCVKRLATAASFLRCRRHSVRLFVIGLQRAVVVAARCAVFSPFSAFFMVVKIYAVLTRSALGWGAWRSERARTTEKPSRSVGWSVQSVRSVDAEIFYSLDLAGGRVCVRVSDN